MSSGRRMQDLCLNGALLCELCDLHFELQASGGGMSGGSELASLYIIIGNLMECPHGLAKRRKMRMKRVKARTWKRCFQKEAGKLSRFSSLFLGE